MAKYRDHFHRAPIRAGIAAMVALALMGTSELSQADAFKPGENAKRMQRLFEIEKSISTIEDRAPHTFIFWIQGAQQHYVPSSRKNAGDPSKYADVDLEYAKRIRNLAEICPSCNVILLHTRPVGKTSWPSCFEGDHPDRATRFEIYSRGKTLLTRTEDLLNGADPKVAEQLISVAYQLFPKSGIHFVYSGHGFSPGYSPMVLPTGKLNPMAALVAFDQNFPSWPYDIDIFASAFPEARRSTGLLLAQRLLHRLEKFKSSAYLKESEWDAVRDELIAIVKQAQGVIPAPYKPVLPGIEARKQKTPVPVQVQPTSKDAPAPDLGKKAILDTLAEIRKLISKALAKSNLEEVSQLRRDLLQIVRVLSHPVASITLAACRMEDSSVRKALWPYGRHVIASISDVNEPLDQGFVYSFIQDVRDHDTSEEVARMIESAIFEYSKSNMEAAAIAQKEKDAKRRSGKTRAEI